MAKKTKQAEVTFEDIQPTSRAAMGQDYLRVSSYGVAFSLKAAPRYLDTPSLSLKIASNGKAIQVSSPGAFRVTIRAERDAKRVFINSIAIPQKAPQGRYFYQGDGLYVRED